MYNNRKSLVFDDFTFRRPSGNPEEDLRDHIYPLKLKQKEDLKAVLTKLQLSNEELLNEASINHAEILHTKECNDDLFKAFSDVSILFFPLAFSIS